MRIMQVQGRAVRYKSHVMLPSNLRHVNTYVYISTYPDGCKLEIAKTEPSTDDTLYGHAKEMHEVNMSFYRSMSEIAIDCVIHNKNPTIHCKLCAPTNVPLFIDDIYKDMTVRSPCMPPEKKDVEAKELLIEGKKYAYYISASKDGSIVVLEYRDDLDGYVESDPNSEIYKIVKDKVLP